MHQIIRCINLNKNVWQKIKVHKQKESRKNYGNVVTKTPSFTISVKRYENNQGTFSMLALLLCSEPHQRRWFKGKSLSISFKYFYYFCWIKKAVLYSLENYSHVVISNGNIDYNVIQKSIFCSTIDERTSSVFSIMCGLSTVVRWAIHH